ncbi:MAG: hypothetical protein GY760_02495 [Deltaproteobacteria bacterium]|nr:hypothetical protein [Deltaproteobacteria bacterium]
MKKLICADDIKKILKQGQKTLCINANTIMTPSAKDAVKAAGLEVFVGSKENMPSCEDASCKNEISSYMIDTALNMMQSKGLLKEVSEKSCEAFAEAIQQIAENPARY